MFNSFCFILDRFFSLRLTSELTDFIETDDLDVFTLQDLEEYNVSGMILFRLEYYYINQHV